MICLANADGLLMVMFGAGLCVGLGMACSSAAMAMAVTAQVVPVERRSMMLGVVSAAGSVGALIAAPIGQTLQMSEGWRVGVLGFAVLVLLVIPAALAAGGVDKRPKPPIDVNSADKLTLGPALGMAFSHVPFLVMSGAYFVCGMQLVFLTTHLPSYLQLCGMDPMLGAAALGTIGGFNVLGSLFFGWAGGRYNKQALLGGMYISRSLLIAWYFVTPPSPESTILFSAIIGFLWLGVSPLVAGSVVEMFGLKWQAMIQGVAFMNHQVGSFLGAFGGGWMFDMLGSYDLAVQIGVGIGIVAGLTQLIFAFRHSPGAPRMA
jgi:MFS family permease